MSGLTTHSRTGPWQARSPPPPRRRRLPRSPPPPRLLACRRDGERGHRRWMIEHCGRKTRGCAEGSELAPEQTVNASVVAIEGERTLGLASPTLSLNYTAQFRVPCWGVTDVSVHYIYRTEGFIGPCWTQPQNHNKDVKLKENVTFYQRLRNSNMFTDIMTKA